LGSFSKSSIIPLNLGQFFKIFHYHSKLWTLFQNFTLSLQALGSFSKFSNITTNQNFTLSLQALGRFIETPFFTLNFKTKTTINFSF